MTSLPILQKRNKNELYCFPLSVPIGQDNAVVRIGEVAATPIEAQLGKTCVTGSLGAQGKEPVDTGLPLWLAPVVGQHGQQPFQQGHGLGALELEQHGVMLSKDVLESR